MPYVEDEQGNHILDFNGNKIPFTVTHENNILYDHKKRTIYKTDSGHIEIIDGLNQNHPVSMLQIQNFVQTAINQFKTQMTQAMIQFRNDQIKNRIGVKKKMNIPKTNYTWIKLLNKTDLKVTSLNDIITLNVFIKRTTRYHHAKSSHAANAFTNLEFFMIAI